MFENTLDAANGIIVELGGVGNYPDLLSALNEIYTLIGGFPPGGNPGGANTDIQFNDSGSFGGDDRFTFDKVAGVFSVFSDINFTDNNGIGSLLFYADNRVLYDDLGREAITFDTFINGRFLYDEIGITIMDFSSVSTLYDDNGDRSFVWGGGQRTLRDNTDVVAMTFAAGGNARKLFDGADVLAIQFDETARTLNDNNAVRALAFRDTLRVLDDETGTGALDFLSTGRILSDELGNQAMQFLSDSRLLSDSFSTTSVDFSARNLFDDEVNISVDWQNRYLYDEVGNQSVEWNEYLLNDLINNTSIDWDDRLLSDSTGTKSVDWQNRMLVDEVGANAMQYTSSSRLLYDDSGIIAASWDTSNGRILYDDFESSIIEFDGPLILGANNQAICIGGSAITPVGFYSVAPVVQQVLPLLSTPAQIVAALQSLGLVRQS